jgi:hypothetical protein
MAPIDTVIYTDGSCKGDIENVGAAAIITGPARNPIVLEGVQNADTLVAMTRKDLQGF